MEQAAATQIHLRFLLLCRSLKAPWRYRSNRMFNYINWCITVLSTRQFVTSWLKDNSFGCRAASAPVSPLIHSMCALKSKQCPVLFWCQWLQYFSLICRRPVARRAMPNISSRHRDELLAGKYFAQKGALAWGGDDANVLWAGTVIGCGCWRWAVKSSAEFFFLKVRIEMLIFLNICLQSCGRLHLNFRS